jgi:WD40-like Beta Propeller Repeat
MVSPDGKHITYWRDPYANGAPTGTAVYTIDRDGTNETQLTDPTTNAGDPACSPNGQWIVFSTYPLNEYNFVPAISNLYRIHPDGTGLEQLTHYDTSATRATIPRYTPDGKWIMFTAVGSARVFPDRVGRVPGRRATMAAAIVRFEVTIGHLRANASPAEMLAREARIANRITGFRFDVAAHFTPTTYDEVWLFGVTTDYRLPVFGVRGSPASGYPRDRLSDSELDNLTAHMNSGRGLFATGDHARLGAGCAGRWTGPATCATGRTSGPAPATRTRARARYRCGARTATTPTRQATTAASSSATRAMTCHRPST